ncbi:hydroxylysine kinase [Ischnura elegans]|uniref:hydroxylysine kinase n=1 Tax=Ischnura elegans TaxID=197161 RepID=UPI001ED8904D|nr:hydroxylysine kinase [Ischnura elegans]XP_046399047.1 hydroxylysine kinase [Ischnura elegans]XP_046399048.1 hydroxylysine kinase [Ischnura elegans]
MKMNNNGGGDSNENLLQPGQQITPIISIELAKDLVQKLFGVKTKEIHELNAYDDKNFHVLADGIENPNIVKGAEHGYVFKVMNSLDSKNVSLVDGQKEIMLFLVNHEIMCPKPVPTLQNEYHSIIELPVPEAPPGHPPGKHLVRLLEYQPGTLFCNVPSSRELFIDAGMYVAKLDNILKDFSHPVYASHKSLWSLSSVPELKKFLFAVKSLDDREMVGRIIDCFEREVSPSMESLEKGMVHGDFNEQNILCAQMPEGEWRVSAILDFGDSHFSCYIFELAIAMCYMMLQCKHMDQLEAGACFLAGYTSVRQLPESEMKILRTCIAARYAQSLILGAYSYSLNPTNDYVMTTAKLGWKQLKHFWATTSESLHSVWDKEIKNVANESVSR